MSGALGILTEPDVQVPMRDGVRMEQRGIAGIASYDKDFDRVTGLQRIEP